MNNFVALDSRSRRNLLAHGMNAFTSPFYKNYSTDTTAEMKSSCGDSLFINTFHLIPETLKSNLADSVVSLNDRTAKTNMAADTKGFVNNSSNMTKSQNSTRSDYYPSMAGITGFFSGVFNLMGAMFQKRANSPVQYYDCFEQSFEDQHQMTPSSLAWQSAKHEDQNKNGRAEADEFANETYTDYSTDMSQDFKSIAAQCEDKLNQVRLLLSNNTVKRTVRPRRLKRAFHEAGSTEELYEDAFTPDDFINLANETFLEYYTPCNLHHEELNEIESPKIKTETSPVKESMEIVKNIKCIADNTNGCEESKSNIIVGKTNEDNVDTKQHVVTACEDKVTKLKALLKGKCQQKNNSVDSKVDLENSIEIVAKTKAIPIPKVCKDAQNQNKTEVIFMKDIEIPITPDSPNVLDPSSYFDEVTGRFYSSSATDSEDSFQIVFSDSPRNFRKRVTSDCESEDSFIVFEESPDSCYTSNEVFGDDSNNATNFSSDSDNSDSDCESDFDSGVNTITLSHTLSRTFGDLTDGSLYEDSKGEDEVDCAFKSGLEIPKELIDEHRITSIIQNSIEDSKKGVLLDEAKKREKKKLPAKKVHFSPQPPKVHVMRVWAFAARQARAGHWERHALDRERFKRRIADVDVAVSWVLKPQHRSRVMFQRFMPWWNAQKRKELAEQKQREERAKKEQEEIDRIKEEARLSVNEESDKNERVAENCSSNNDIGKADANEVNERILDTICTMQDGSIGVEKEVDLDSSIKNIHSNDICIGSSKGIFAVLTGNNIDDKVEIAKRNIKICNGLSDSVIGPIANVRDVSNDKATDYGVAALNLDSEKTKYVKEKQIGVINGDCNLNHKILNGVDKAGGYGMCRRRKQAL